MEDANSELALLKRQLAEARKRAEDLEAAESQRQQAANQRQLEESKRSADDMEAWLNDPNFRVAYDDRDTHSQIGRGRDYSRNRDCSRNRDHSQSRCSERRGREHRRNSAYRSHSRSPSIECHNQKDRTKRRDRRSRSRSNDNCRSRSNDYGRSRSPLPTPPHELELKSVRARLARLHGEAEMEPTAERQGQINALMYKLKTLQREVKREC